MKRKELSYKERCKVEALLQEGKSLRLIANNLGRGKTTIGDEIERNGGKNNYRADRAQHKAYIRRWRAKRNCNKVALSRELTHYVEKKLRLLWSPERIAGRMKENKQFYASSKSIRKYIKRRSGLERFLFWKNKRFL